MAERKRKILGAPLGNDVHVAGILGFLRLAEDQGYDTEFLGPAAGTAGIINACMEYRPHVLAVSYRLTPEVVPGLINELTNAMQEAGLKDLELVFGGTAPVARAAKITGVFRAIFSGLEGPEEVIAYLQGRDTAQDNQRYPGELISRMESKRPYPLLRHHFGLPDMQATLDGIKQIAGAKVLDIISIGPDQNAQASFFRPDEIDESQAGAGGVPIRTADDLRSLYEASRSGNFPLLRIYSGTRDLHRWAELAVETIKNAWAAIPLCWYSELDGRSNRPLLKAMQENLNVMAWYANKGIPVEVNEAHHWSLRESSDTIAVAMAYIAAHNAKSQGVRRYIAQYMFNTPNGVWYNQDLAKMLAKQELIQSLHDNQFRSYTQVRTGLASLSPNLNMAKGQLASSMHLALALKPDIVHVVGFSEADHAAKPEDVIESCEIVRGMLHNTLHGLPAAGYDPRVQRRKDELLAEAKVLIDAIKCLGRDHKDPLSSPEVLVDAISQGLLDAPHLRGSSVAKGKLQTRLIDGACLAVHPDTAQPLSETDRLQMILNRKVR